MGTTKCDDKTVGQSDEMADKRSPMEPHQLTG